MTRFARHFTGVTPGKRYDPKTALSLAVACDLAYSDATIIEDITTGWGFEHHKHIDIHKGPDIHTQGYIAANATDILCVFRGTDDIDDWFANFQAAKDPGPLTDTRAHEGFQDALYPAVIAISNAIDNVGGAEKRLWLTGHSLGGALASLYAGMLIEHGYAVYGLYTFASPRPADFSFAEQLDQHMQHGPHYRVINEGDVIPHVPPEPFFSHPGKRILLSCDERSSSKRDWTSWRKRIFAQLMAMAGKPWRVKKYHQLGAPQYGYIARLRKDEQRCGDDRQAAAVG